MCRGGGKQRPGPEHPRQGHAARLVQEVDEIEEDARLRDRWNSPARRITRRSEGAIPAKRAVKVPT